MFTERSVTYGDPRGQHQVITREVFTADRRILGTETTTEKWFEGEMSGWRWVESCTDTRQFGHISEAQEWLDDLQRRWEIAQVKASGGTKLVVIT